MLFEAGTLLDEDKIEEIERLGIDEVKVRTPLTCETRYGMCASVMAAISAGEVWSIPVKQSALSLHSPSVNRVPS